MTQVITLDEINTLSAEEINSRVKAMDYDEFKYQLDNKIVIDHPERTKGLHKVLYQCDSCLTEFKNVFRKD